MSEEERNVKLEEIMIRHPELMTEEELKNLEWKQSFLKASVLFTLLSPIYSAHHFRLIKKNPIYKAWGLNRIFIIPAISFFCLTYSAIDHSKANKKMIARYLSGITDYEINNFDALYI
jgi:hypothetical protein